MKNENSFDIPAYNFGILKFNDAYKRLLKKNGNDGDFIQGCIKEATESYGSYGSYIDIIPFEYIDGLTLEEVKTFLNLDGPIVLSCYAYCKSFNSAGVQNKFSLLHNFIFLENKVNENLSEQIDKMMEELCEEHYANSSTKLKRVLRCFLERYQDNSHQDTFMRIKKLEQ